jgi:3-oxoacyl-(acyl-carrier-protein) synthase III
MQHDRRSQVTKHLLGASSVSIPTNGPPVAQLAGFAHSLPDRRAATAEIEGRIAGASGRLPVPAGALGAISGVRERRMVGDGEYASTLAVAAGRRAMAEAGFDASEVDLLIFAATSQDQVEPATAHIIAAELGIRGASVFDVKNACNSVIDGLRVAEALMARGSTRRALVVTGETPTIAARYRVSGVRGFRDAFLGYTVGDAGGAIALEPSDGHRGIFYHHVHSESEHWWISQVKGGGSRNPRGDEFSYAGGDGAKLRDAFRSVDADIGLRVFRETGTTRDDYGLFLVHQVTGPLADEFVERLGLPRERVMFTVEDHGNVAAASLPLGLSLARDAGRVALGDRVLFFGLGAGLSVATLALVL